MPTADRERELRQRLFAWTLDKRTTMELHTFIEEIRPQRASLPGDETSFLFELWDDLHRRGLLTPDISQRGTSYGVFWTLTRRGEVALKANDLLATEPSAFVATAVAGAPEIDALAFEYLADAVACLDQHLPRPAAVMLGVCFEIAAEQVGGVIMKSVRPQRLPAWEKERSIARRWALAVDALKSAGRAERDFLDRESAVLTIVRLQRNDAGHATRPDIDEETVRAFIAIAPNLLASLNLALKTLP